MAQRLIALAVTGLFATAAAAQLADPTRPAALGALEQGAPAAASAPPSRLQSVLISPGRRVAVIDGRMVSLGDRVGDSKLIAVAPTEVVLERGARRETLKLLPSGVEKKRVKP